MASRFSVFTIILLITVGFVSTGSSRRRSSPPKLSDNIDNNPFLHNHGTSSSDGRQRIPSNDNLFAASKNHDDSIWFYDDNPFLHNPASQGSQRPATVPSTNSQANQSKLTLRRNATSTNKQEKTKSELKCDEFANQICITPPKPGEAHIFVTGGVAATPGEYPHMVALGFKDNTGTFQHSCGGTLIDREWVLTAAHCTHGPERPRNVRIGFHNLKNQQGIETTINKIVRHPNYKPPAMYFDIALVKLNTKVKFAKEIRPACLFPQSVSVPTRAWVTGWGATEFLGEEPSDELQKAQLDILKPRDCAGLISRSTAVPNGITSSMLCTGDPQGGWTRDTCQGDSGGPLQVFHRKHSCLFEVVGITSFGLGCALVDKPGVYTQVSHYLNWIESVVWP